MGRVSPALKTNVITEAATGSVLKEKMFLAISQNSQENICARVSLLKKFQASVSEKRYSSTSVFICILWNL